MDSAVAFNLPVTVLGATLGSIVLTAALALAARMPGAPPGMALFAAAFGIHVGRYMLLLCQGTLLPVTPAAIAASSLHVGTAALLLAGTQALL
ncbi:MAG: hypothetical protein K2Q10_05030, partial [Rhodospirillales bacterium]|nr:hypothetical protein [Rhodospirillales bacterium]